jgi:hypothetical protein
MLMRAAVTRKSPLSPRVRMRKKPLSVISAKAAGRSASTKPVSVREPARVPNEAMSVYPASPLAPPGGRHVTRAPTADPFPRQTVQ